MSRGSIIDHRGREIEVDSVSDIDLDKLLGQAIKKQQKKNIEMVRKKEKEMVEFKDVREKERQLETADLGPGAIDTLKPMGTTNTNKMTIGGRIEMKIENFPEPGKYDVESAFEATRPNQRAAHIKEDISKELSMKDKEAPMPEAGQYEPHAKFGDIKQKMTLGRKYKDDTKSGTPAIGQYEIDTGEELIHPRSYQAMILPEE